MNYDRDGFGLRRDDCGGRAFRLGDELGLRPGNFRLRRTEADGVSLKFGLRFDELGLGGDWFGWRRHNWLVLEGESSAGFFCAVERWVF